MANIKRLLMDSAGYAVRKLVVSTAGTEAAVATSPAITADSDGLILTGGVAVTGGLRVASTTGAAISGATVLTAADSGGKFSLGKASAYAVTLPTPAQGMDFLFSVADTGANAVTFSDGSAHLYGQIQEAGTIPIAMTGTTITAVASQAVGDWIRFEGISATQYHVTGSSITASKWTVA